MDCNRTLIRLNGRHSSFIILSTSLTTTARANGFGTTRPRHFCSTNVTRDGLVKLTTNVTAANRITFTDAFTVCTTNHTCRRIHGSVNCPRLGIGVNTARTNVSINRSNTARRYYRSVTLVHAVPNVAMVIPTSSVRTHTYIHTTCRFRKPICVHFKHLTAPIVGSRRSCRFGVNHNIIIHRKSSIAVVTYNLVITRTLRTTRTLTTSNVSTRIVGVRAVGPLSRHLIITDTGGANHIIATRRRSVVNNLNRTITSILTRRRPIPVHHINIHSICNRSNPTISLLRGCNLSTSNVRTTIESILWKEFP